jgi:hypothetical protein
MKLLPEEEIHTENELIFNEKKKRYEHYFFDKHRQLAQSIIACKRWFVHI